MGEVLAPVGEAESDSSWDDALAAAAREDAQEAAEAAQRDEAAAEEAAKTWSDVPDDEGPAGQGQEAGASAGESSEDVEVQRVMRNPKMPSAREVDEHETTHFPARDWCRACVYGRGISDRHRRQMPHPMDAAIPEEVMTPVLSLDFTFMGTTTVRAQANPYLVMYDNDTGATKV